MPLDLDAIERGIERGKVRQVFTADELYALVAELRAAQAVVADARLLANTTGFAAPEVHAERRGALLASLAAYDQHTSPAPPEVDQ